MFTLISCPTCQHKFTVPEAAMGKRHSCPHCQALFTAGKSVADAPAEVAMKLQSPAEMPMNKTMLGETAPPIKYNCPRCKKPLESPAIEARTKKPCPFCGGRLQVPDAPAPAAGPPLNKTLLASDEGAPKPTGIMPTPSYGAVAPPPGAPMTMPSTQAPAPAAAGPLGLSPKVLTIGGIVAGGFVFLLLLACVLTFATGGNARAEKEKYEALLKEIADAKADAAKREQKREEIRQAEEAAERDRRKMKQKWDDDEEDYRRRMRAIQDNRALKEEDKLEQERRVSMEKKQRELEKLEWDAKFERLEKQRKLDQEDNDRRLREAQNRAATVVVQPPVYYRYHPHWGWGYY